MKARARTWAQALEESRPLTEEEAAGTTLGFLTDGVPTLTIRVDDDTDTDTDTNDAIEERRRNVETPTD